MKIVVFILGLIAMASSCISNKHNAIRDNEYHILRIRQAVNQQIDSSDEFYCLIKAPANNIKVILSTRYKSKYDFYNMLQDTLAGHCILDYYPKFWKNACNTGRFSFLAGSESDSVASKKVLDQLHDDRNYDFYFLEMDRPQDSKLFIGISKFKEIDYCRSYYSFQCILTKSDSTVVLKRLQ